MSANNEQKRIETPQHTQQREDDEDNVPYYIRTKNRHPRVPYDTWKEKRSAQLVCDRRQRQLRNAERIEAEDLEKKKHVEHMRERRIYWQHDRKRRNAQQVLDLRAFNEYNEKAKAKDRSLQLLKQWKEEQLVLLRKSLRQRSALSRVVLQQESRTLEPLLYDPAESSIARLLQSERRTLLSTTLPRNKRGVDVYVSTMDPKGP